ncbi:MAG: RAQPRD family integrative conjugative element protein [Gammaproteobacteria bacterium]|nr:RAQPRD family integrative conjugative element protein [Gammaproteobacteria bacterium]MCY4358847.1 RAQPRD family integrative conjugative element protein [Gammaproteobacteria bacterium]
MQYLIWIALSLTISLSTSPVALADTEAEREALTRLVYEIRLLEQLIQRAEANASSKTRIRFRYDWLRQDLKLIRNGVQAHLDVPDTAPRIVPSLRGDYRH